MNNEKVKQYLMTCIEKCAEDITYYKNNCEKRECYLDTINYYEGLINGYKDTLNFIGGLL